MTKTQNPFIAAEWIRRAVNQDYIEDNLVEYDWILAQDEDGVPRERVGGCAPIK